MTSDIKYFDEESLRRLRDDHYAMARRLDLVESRLRNALACLETGRRIFGRFTLNAAMAKTEATKAATLIGQHGRGSQHSTSITLNNPADSTNGNYTYSGASGASGWAFYDPIEMKWWIFDMDCPAA